MTEREFLKLNTSIQTGSNARTIVEQEDGTIPATIELRLPDNIFGTRVGDKKVDKVSMLTTKLRLSMSETPITKLPIDTTLSTPEITVSKCKMDVYPLNLNDEGELRPDPINEVSNTAFPAYKKHEITYHYKVYTDLENFVWLQDVDFCNGNDILHPFPTTSRLYPIMKANNLLGNHLMNMCIAHAHEKPEIDGEDALIRKIETVEDMLSNALESAITYASTETKQIVTIVLINSLYASQVSPDDLHQPNKSVSVHIDELNMDICFWYTDENNVTSTKSLQYGCIPSFTFSEQGIQIAYDTIPFSPTIPILGVPGFIDTYDIATQLRMDELRESTLYRPPPKRVYKYGVTTSGDTDSLSYEFTLPNPLDSKIFNIIVNKETKETFPFLPWTEIPAKTLNQYTQTETKSEYGTFCEEVKDETNNVDYFPITRDLFVDPSTPALRLYHEAFRNNAPYEYHAGYNMYTGTNIDDDFPPEIRAYLQDIYPLQNLDYSTSTIVMAQALYIPTDDSGFAQTGFLYDSNADNRKKQAIFFPIDMQGGQTVPTSSTEYTLDSGPIKAIWPYRPQPIRTQKSYFLPETACITLEPMETKHDFLRTEGPTTTTSSTSRQEIFSQPPPIAFYYYENEGFWIGTTSKPGEWYRQYFGGMTGRDSAFMQTLGDAFQYVPRVAPNSEFMVRRSPSDPTSELAIFTIDDVDYYCGCMIWILYKPGDSATRLKAYYTSDPLNLDRKTTTIDVITQDFYDEVLTLSSETSVSNFVYPNLLESTQEPFYYLNPADAQLSIGPQEVIGSTEESLKFHVVQQVTQEITEDLEKLNCDFFTDVDEETQTFSVQQTGYKVGDWQEGLSIYRIYYSYIYHQDTQINTDFDVDFVLKSNKGVISTQDAGTTNTHTPTPSTPTTRTNEFDSNDDTYASQIGTTIRSNTTTIPGTWSLSASPVHTHSAEYYSHVLHRWANTVWSDDYHQYYPSEEQPIQTMEPSQTDPNLIKIINMFELEITSPEIPYNWREYTNARQGDLRRTNTQTTQTTTTIVSLLPQTYAGNVRLKYVWENIPTVVLSPIQSYVLVLNGMNVSQEIHPVNINQPGNASLVSTIPIIENYYSLASTLRDLHDELVVVKDTYSDSAFYNLDVLGGQERTLTLSMKYITKDGRLHQLYIPKNGIFSLQITFCLSYYFG